jgi:hypothetical protein
MKICKLIYKVIQIRLNKDEMLEDQESDGCKISRIVMNNWEQGTLSL